MATTYKSTYKRFNGIDWDTHYFKTSADVIVETTTYKVLTASERTLISTYLSSFNAANKLLQLDSSGLIPEGLIPGGLDYLPIGGGTLTGNLVIGSGFTIQTEEINSASGIAINAGADSGIISLKTLSAFNIELDAGGNIDAKSNRIFDLGTPTLSNDAVTKQYVDDLASIGARPAVNGPVEAASTGNLTLSGEQTVDGVLILIGHRVLVKDQTTTSQNGIYTVQPGAWAKDTTDSTEGTMIFVDGGTTYNDWTFYNSNGTTWSQFTRIDTITAGSGLTKTGTEIAVTPLGITNNMLGGSIEWNKLESATLLDNSNAIYNSWAKITGVSTPKYLSAWVSSILGSIGLLRGTANFNTDNTHTIEANHNLVITKNRTYIGSGDPSTSGYITGDSFFQTI